MSLLNIPTLENATGEVKEIFEEIQAAFGMIPNGISVWSANPALLRLQWDSIKIRLSKDQENQKLHAIIRYLASDENECTYCVGFNGGMLMNYYDVSQEQLIEIQSSPASAPLDEKNKALLIFAMKSIKDSDAVSVKDIQLLKDLGITEEEIFEIVHAASHMTVINTLFKTFKVQQDA